VTQAVQKIVRSLIELDPPPIVLPDLRPLPPSRSFRLADPIFTALARLGYSSQLLETVLRLPCGRVNHAARHSFACRCMQAGQY
jgi:hypothetical protein